MKLRPRLVITALAVAFPVAILLFLLNDSYREAERRASLERVVAAQLTDDVRERCEANSRWFLAGPRPDRPTAEQMNAPDADVTAPRPRPQELPFDYFAYDDAYQPSSVAGPRFPADLKVLLRGGAKRATVPYDTPDGRGWQVAVATGWDKSECPVLLYRMRALPGQRAEALWSVVVMFGALVVVAFVAAAPTIWRIRRIGLEARQSASDDYKASVDVSGRDEMSALAFAFNEAAEAIRRRSADVRDREESLRRLIANTSTSVTEPLLALEQRLGEVNRQGSTADMRAELQHSVTDAHTLAMRIQNLSAASTLRMSMESASKDVVDLNELMEAVANRQEAFARASGVTIQRSPSAPPIKIGADRALLEQAVSNLVDNAIRYNRSGGQATITIEPTRDGRFSLRVADDGPGAPEDVLANLNANRRFRGDEGKAGRSGELGLGLAVVREVCDRFGIHWAFRTSAKGWFEAELTGPARI